ncbi:ADP-ribosylglycohydrolase family protein [Vicingus serpentipes]|uniref:ADP-ribosylglycohydrolase family protein n=1 Tax=Vicingus serpentipes TaxID=1926625 RepID=A0A5C6RXS1_9FLAO|nr:ADP-ribosylglycohydrolase family protein [Vicingus serpentipes]TXB66162.1 ADP-ribosylglycohydrolase family protein [Vicingus serpentipes]
MKRIIFGIAVGDALGVPVEFVNRNELKKNPISSMTGYGTYNQPKGTWSDDTSMTLCLIETLNDKVFSLQKLSNRFINWYEHNYWTPHGDVFDIGGTTQLSIINLIQGVSPIEAGQSDEFSNGNGSLMRILPLLYLIRDKPIEDRFELIKDVSSITHAHIYSVFSCFVYLEFALLLYKNYNIIQAYEVLINNINDYINSNNLEDVLGDKFDRILSGALIDFPEDKIKSDGYVIHTLEASLWCLLSTQCFYDAVLKAVNLGGDSDTTGAVVGGLAGLYYGFEQIPEVWINKLARKDDLFELAERSIANNLE